MKRVLYSGWLTKSPPERKTWKIIKPQWRRRFFVLSSIHASNVLPGTCPAQLEYFDNEKQTKRKGSINLNNCEHVLAHVESECYRHIFVVKTTHRGHQRAYYLAADSEEEMDRWVNQLRSLLVLQDEGPTTFAPTTFGPRLKHTQSTTIPPTNVPIATRPLWSTPANSADSAGLLSPVSEIVDPFDSSPHSGNQQSPEDYFHLNQCSSGETPVPAPRLLSPVRVVTVNVRNQLLQTSLSSQQSSASDEYYNTTGEDTGGRGSEIYKVPPSRDSDIYKVPSSGGFVRDSTYDYPPSAGREWNRDSNYDYPPPLNSLNDEANRDSTYDYPPSGVPRRSCDSETEQPLWECESKLVSEVDGDTYDVLPSKSNGVPGRPNGRPDSVDAMGCPPSPHDICSDAQSANDVYDIPPLTSRSSNLLPPPKAHPMAPKMHRYINAAPTPVAANRLTPPTPPRVSTDDNVYLAMSSFESVNSAYVPLVQTDNCSGQPRRLKSATPSPASRVNEKPPKAPMTLPRSFAKEEEILTVMNNTDDPAYSCHATQRTRSFKRRVPSPGSENVILPQKVGAVHSSSSSEDEDGDSSETNSVQEYLNLKNSAGSVRELPIQPAKPIVQYLDLDLNTSPPLQSSVSPSSSDSQNKIEYNEIDMERTTALFNAKLMLEKERKGSDKSES